MGCGCNKKKPANKYATKKVTPTSNAYTDAVKKKPVTKSNRKVI